MTHKRKFKFWISRTILFILLLGVIWIVNLIWFKPFNIRHFYDRLFIETALNSPETCTQMGIPIIYDLSKDELDDISMEKKKENFKKLHKDYNTLMSYDFESQSEENKLNTKIMAYFIKDQLDGEDFLGYDYPINQLFGIQLMLPGMMEKSHKLRNKSDAKAYISRLSKFKTKFDQIIENLKISASNGVMPPRFVIEKVLTQMKRFTEDVQTNILYTNFVTKIDALDDISEEDKVSLKASVEEEVKNMVFTAYQDLIQYLEGQLAVAKTDDGVWKFPNGDAYYSYLLKQNTSTDLSPEEVHQIGLNEVKQIKAQMWAILKQQGYQDTTQSLGEIIRSLSNDENFLYPDSEEGREQLVAEYNRILQGIDEGLGDAFDMRPKSGLEVKPVPKFKEDGTPKALYFPPLMDGSQGGVFYVNLKDMHAHAKFEMKPLAYHEGIPGHHFQFALQSEMQDVPFFRRVGLFTSYVEGWALYTERLAWELGFYENDPFGDLGRLQAEMWRAVRLVVDTGIHYKKWTREEAIAYMSDNVGISENDVITEIERYIVLPGQACAYKIGMIKIMELREKAKAKLGDQFKLKEFHNAVLKNGAVPLTILEELIDDYINETLNKALS